MSEELPTHREAAGQRGELRPTHSRAEPGRERKTHVRGNNEQLCRAGQRRRGEEEEEAEAEAAQLNVPSSCSRAGLRHRCAVICRVRPRRLAVSAPCPCIKYGLYSNMVALITSNCGAHADAAGHPHRRRSRGGCGCAGGAARRRSCRPVAVPERLWAV